MLEINKYFIPIVSIFGSVLIAFLTIKIQNRYDKKKTSDLNISEILSLIQYEVRNHEIINPKNINKLLNEKIKFKSKENLITQIRIYNSTLQSYKKYIEDNLIDLYLRTDSDESEEIEAYLNFHFDDETNRYLDNMAKYITHENSQDWINYDRETMNFFKRKMHLRCSDGYEMEGIFKLDAAIKDKEVRKLIDYEYYMISEIDEIKIEFLELKNALNNLITKEIKRH